MTQVRTGLGADLMVVDPRSQARIQTLTSLFGSVTSVIIWVVAALMVLSELGVSIAPLLASAGIAGVALGFGAQSLVKDFLSGVFMVLEDQYGVGDDIDAGEATGTVEQVNLRSTRLRSADGTVWFIPNGEIRRVGNRSRQWARALLDISVGYGSDLDRVRGIVLEVATEVCERDDQREVVLEPPEVLGVEALALDGVILRLVIKTEPGAQEKLTRALRLALKDRFDAEGVEIPLPQRVLHLRPDSKRDRQVEEPRHPED
jgi:small conductance mechanosensitive channel